MNSVKFIIILVYHIIIEYVFNAYLFITFCISQDILCAYTFNANIDNIHTYILRI